MNDQSKLQPQPMPIPDIILSKEAVGQILMALNNAIIFVKAQDGLMRPFVDPIPIQNILQQAINATLKNPGGPP